MRPAEVEQRVRLLGPDWIINCAAYTQVDRAESEPEQAFTVNRDSPAALARAAAACNAGGVGKYSRSNFVHMDCGPVRTWGG